MNLFFKKLGYFILFTVIFYLLSLFAIGKWFPQSFKPNLNYVICGYGHSLTRFNDAKQLNTNLDILFLGSSHAYRGFDPRNFPGKQTFNLGSNSQTPIQTDLLLDRYLDKLNPKMIIYEVFPKGFCSDGAESALDIISNDKNDFGSLCMALKINDVKVYNTLIYALWRDVLYFGKRLSEPQRKKQYNDTYIRDGFVEKDIQRFTNSHKVPSNKWKIKKKQIEAFEKSLLKIKSKGIKLELVYAPITSSLYQSYSNNEEFDSLMIGYGFPYYNFNEILQLNDSIYFYDEHHLNKDGVLLFNSKLNDTLSMYDELKIQ